MFPRDSVIILKYHLLETYLDVLISLVFDSYGV